MAAREPPMSDPPEPDPPDAEGRSALRARILEAAARLIVEGGVSALTTRAVAAGAGVQAPALYRQFGDKRGLLEALAEHRLAAYVAAKSYVAPSADPVQALRESWDAHIAFGLAEPAVFAIINEPGRKGPPSAAQEAGLALLRAQVHQIARAGRLRTLEARAVSLVQAAATGTVMTLLESAVERRDPGLSAAARDAVITALTQEGAAGAPGGVSATAVRLRSRLDELDPLTPGERLLLGEMLDKITHWFGGVDGERRLAEALHAAHDAHHGAAGALV